MDRQREFTRASALELTQVLDQNLFLQNQSFENGFKYKGNIFVRQAEATSSFPTGTSSQGRSEQHKSWKCQNGQADSELRQSTDFRTVFGIKTISFLQNKAIMFYRKQSRLEIMPRPSFKSFSAICKKPGKIPGCDTALIEEQNHDRTSLFLRNKTNIFYRKQRQYHYAEIKTNSQKSVKRGLDVADITRKMLKISGTISRCCESCLSFINVKWVPAYMSTCGPNDSSKF